MLSSDRFEPPGGRRPRAAQHGAGTPEAGSEGAGDACDPVGPDRVRNHNPNEPWDAQSAEALTRLYESDEARLCKPRAGERARRTQPQPKSSSATPADEAGTDDRAWLERQLSDLDQRLHASLARLDPGKSLAALSGRLEAIEDRFSVALERVAQRADLDGLRSIEAHVLELATHLERTRERLEQIGALEDHLRLLARRVDEEDLQQLGTHRKLLREYVAEWRESEQRTASALHNLEEAINRLGDTVDAMEASKPALDLSLPTLGAPVPGRGGIASDPLAQLHAASERAAAPKAYHSMLDAADYAPKSAPEATRPAATSEAAARPVAGGGLPTSPDANIGWSAEPASAGLSRPVAGQSGPRASRIIAARAKLRQAQVPATEATDEQDALAPAEHVSPKPTATKRTPPSLLLIAGVAFLAGGAYLLFQAFMVPTPLPTSPARIEPSVQPSGAKQGWQTPWGDRLAAATCSARWVATVAAVPTDIPKCRFHL